MDATISNPFRAETIVEFLWRTGGVYTMDVAARFGMSLEECRDALRILELGGQVQSSREVIKQGAALLWIAKP